MTSATSKGSRFAAAALLFAALAPSPAAAGAFGVNPVAVAVMPDKGAAELRLENADLKPVAVRVTALHWTLANGRDRTEATRDLVVSPPIFTVEPGAKQLIRIGFRNRTPGAAYRLIVEEIPSPKTPGTGINVALKLDLPLYVIARPEAVPTLKWAARRGPDGALIVEGRNSGDLHAQIVAIEARDAAGKVVGRTGAMGVVLPSSSRVWSLGKTLGPPAGMATAVYGASGGLAVLLLKCPVSGGQAGASARIENFLGFPTGISGRALMGRAYAQAQKFGAEMVLPLLAESMESVDGGYRLTTQDGQRSQARTVVIASGVVYRRPEIPDIETCEGSGVHYWASPVEARLCAGEEVALVGGGNSAGQAVVYLAGHVRKVHMIVRGDGLAQSMSRYLVQRIAALPM